MFQQNSLPLWSGKDLRTFTEHSQIRARAYKRSSLDLVSAVNDSLNSLDIDSKDIEALAVLNRGAEILGKLHHGWFDFSVEVFRVCLGLDTLYVPNIRKSLAATLRRLEPAVS